MPNESPPPDQHHGELGREGRTQQLEGQIPHRQERQGPRDQVPYPAIEQ